jgi:hypothetical protein
MVCRPSQHGQGHGQIIMLSRRADIADAIFGPFKFQRVELLKGAARHRSINQADLIGAEFLQQPVQQEGAAKPIDPHKTVLEDSGFNRGAIAGGADLG